MRLLPPLVRPRVDVVLHVGSGKTGTSSVQSFLKANRARLARKGVLYPLTPGRARHVQLGFYIKTEEELQHTVEWRRADLGTLAEFRARFRADLVEEIRDSGASRVIFSDEALYAARDDALKRLRGLTDRVAREVTVVVYLRRQDDHLVSRYQQSIKTGAIRRLDEFARLDHTGIYDYETRLARFRRLLRPDALVVRRFEPARFGEGGLYQDFLTAAGVQVPAKRLKPVESQNESLDADSVEFLRLCNLYRVEEEGATPGVIDNRSLFRRLDASGPTLTLADDVFAEFMAQWADANRAVAQASFGEDELFLPRRASRSTTTEQRLDPARLDDLFARVELPEEMHAGVRRIAEREAAVAGGPR